mmetsp:Transcript_25254/g.57318  ORF Transcript_25254/g.57318 Transcript_25254/m.57318 type:complete len:1018 (+) Transcript_25254:135-3188(+)
MRRVWGSDEATPSSRSRLRACADNVDFPLDITDDDLKTQNDILKAVNKASGDDRHWIRTSHNSVDERDPRLSSISRDGFSSANGSPRVRVENSTRGSLFQPNVGGQDPSPQWGRGRKALVNEGDLGFGVNEMRETKIEPAQRLRVKGYIKDFMDSRPVSIVSVCITVYALVGDDFRLMVTEKPTDNWFNAMAIVCLIFFTIEIILSSIGKPDYFLSFFFTLDVIATLSCILDLTWVSDGLMEDVNSLENSRGGRTAKVGATAGRVVRVLRLVRIVKLYKAYFEKVTRSNKNKAANKSEKEVKDLWDEDELPEDDDTHQESIVGKKLVSLTTRHVIILVLIMLLVMPYLRVDVNLVSSSSVDYGADSVWLAFKHMQQNASRRINYEDELLKYVYYHNWYAGACPDFVACPSLFYSHVFWIGMAGSSMSAAQNYADQAWIRDTSVSQWQQAHQSQKLRYDLSTMPTQAQNAFTQVWTTQCQYGGMLHVGTSLLPSSQGVRCPNDVRPQERFRVGPQLRRLSQTRDTHMAFFFDIRPYVREEALMSLASTAFICVVLLISTLFFSHDADYLVLNPVERMVEKVKIIANDPLIAMKMADAEFEFEELKKYNKSKHKSTAWLRLQWTRLCKRLPVSFGTDKTKQEPMETVILEKTIIKLGSLLALGFGEAGVNIVSTNMRGLNTSGVNAMIPGSRVDCIIATAKIRDFSSATEVLQGKVMTFVNQIAEIIHGIVTEYHGAANKNNGDTFLLIWRTDTYEEAQQMRLADMCMVTFARIMGAVHQSPVLARYRVHPGLQQRCWRVNLSFGMHYGWAIEGAVGSEFKIDASYLSPNVNISGSLEQATKFYGVHLMASETVIQRCSKDMVSKCRLVDKVNIRGSLEPLELYVLDLDFNALKVIESRRIPWNMRQRFRARQMLEMEKKEKWAEDLCIADIFHTASDVQKMRRLYTEEFMELFKMAYQCYSEGEWMPARRLLMKTHEMLGPKDGPSGKLLRFMEASQFQAPSTWRGVHPLDSSTFGGA